MRPPMRRRARPRTSARGSQPWLPDMWRFAVSLSSLDDADDLVQDALTRAWTKRDSFDPARGTARSWLLAIVADRARRRWLRRPTPVLPASPRGRRTRRARRRPAARDRGPARPAAHDRLPPLLPRSAGARGRQVLGCRRDGQVRTARRAPRAGPAAGGRTHDHRRSRRTTCAPTAPPGASRSTALRPDSRAAPTLQRRRITPVSLASSLPRSWSGATVVVLVLRRPRGSPQRSTSARRRGPRRTSSDGVSVRRPVPHMRHVPQAGDLPDRTATGRHGVGVPVSALTAQGGRGTDDRKPLRRSSAPEERALDASRAQDAQQRAAAPPAPHFLHLVRLPAAAGPSTAAATAATPTPPLRGNPTTGNRDGGAISASRCRRPRRVTRSPGNARRRAASPRRTGSRARHRSPRGRRAAAEIEDEIAGTSLAAR